MKTLGDYSEICRNLTDVMREIADGKIIVISIKFNLALLLLQTDGMIEPIEDNGKLQTVRLSDKGRELLQRGGYSDFIL